MQYYTLQRGNGQSTREAFPDGHTAYWAARKYAVAEGIDIRVCAPDGFCIAVAYHAPTAWGAWGHFNVRPPISGRSWEWSARQYEVRSVAQR